MAESPTIRKAFDDYENNAREGAMYLGPVNNSTIYAPVSIVHYCDNGDIWLETGWYAQKRPTKKCQARITVVDGKLTVVMPWLMFSRMRYKHCLDVRDSWKVDDFRFITSW